LYIPWLERADRAIDVAAGAALKLVLGARYSSAARPKSLIEETVDIIERLVEEYTGHYVEQRGRVS
jgi:hypothetical protein